MFGVKAWLVLVIQRGKFGEGKAMRGTLLVSPFMCYGIEQDVFSEDKRLLQKSGFFHMSITCQSVIKNNPQSLMASGWHVRFLGF